MSGCGGCAAGGDQELCLGKHHHPGHAMDLAKGSEDKETIVSHY